MNNDRMYKINAQLQKEISEIIQKLKDPALKGIISVTAVNTTRDLKNADVFVSVFNSGGEEDGVVAVLNNSAAFIKGVLFKSLGIRNVPKLRFIKDDSMEYSQKINRILGEINNDK